MTQTTGHPPKASDKQIKLVRDLVTERPNWQDRVSGQVLETVFDVLGGVDNPDAKFVSLYEARVAIRALLAVPKPPPAHPRALAELQKLLGTLHLGHYALPRVRDGVIDFFEVVERPGKTGGSPTRWINRLLGSPGSWNREKLPVALQAAAGRAIAGDWVAAAKLYADKFQACARCDAPLSNPRSRAARIGHDCAKAWGWSW